MWQSAYLASMRPRVQAPVLPHTEKKKKKKPQQSKLYILISLTFIFCSWCIFFVLK
jgi:hypothetical protein